MKVRDILPILGSLAIAAGQSPSKAIITNLDTAKWVHEKGESESVVLRDDPSTGGMELLVRISRRPCDPAALARV